MKRARQLPLWPTAVAAREELEAVRQHLAANLKARRERRGLTQQAVAERAGLGRSYLSGVERARHDVKLDTVARLAWALGVTVPDLLRGPADRPARRRRSA